VWAVQIIVIAEIGWNHMGDMGLAKKMINAAHEAGASYAKFQTWSCSRLKRGPWDNDGRTEIYKKAELRFHQMIKNGAIDEVKSLYENKKISKTLFKAHGLPELLSCVRNKLSLDEAIYLGIKNTKRYIKRQFTWWNNQKFSQLNLRINYKKSFPKDSIENISIYLNEQ